MPKEGYAERLLCREVMKPRDYYAKRILRREINTPRGYFTEKLICNRLFHQDIFERKYLDED